MVPLILLLPHILASSFSRQGHAETRSTVLQTPANRANLQKGPQGLVAGCLDGLTRCLACPVKEVAPPVVLPKVKSCWGEGVEGAGDVCSVVIMLCSRLILKSSGG